MTSESGRFAAPTSLAIALLAAVATTSTSASAAPTVSDPRVVLQGAAQLDPTTVNEALVGNGTDVFGAWVQNFGTLSFLRGTYFTLPAADLTPEVPTGVVLSGSMPRDPQPAAGSRRATLAMNAHGTVLGAYAADTFRIGRDGAITSIALTSAALPAAPLFPTTGPAQAVALVGDSGAGATGTFLFVACTPTACTLQRIDDTGARIGDELPLFTFADGATTPALVAADYVPGQGFRVVAAQGQQVLTAVVTPAAITPEAPLDTLLAPVCAGWAVTSLRVGRGATVDTVQARITTTCDGATATWIMLSTLAPRADMLCGAQTGIDQCLFTSSDLGLFTSTGATATAVATGTPLTLPTWPGPLHLAPGPGGALAVAANVPALARLVPETTPIDGAIAWRPVLENGDVNALSASTATGAANGADFRAGITRGPDRFLLRGDAAFVPFPVTVGQPAIAIAETAGARTFVATASQLVLFGADAGVAASFPNVLALGHNADSTSAIAIGLQGGVTNLLYAYALDPDTFAPAPAVGSFPNTPAGVTKASLISPIETSTVARVAFDGTHYLVAFTRGLHLDGALLALDGTLATGPFAISRALYQQQNPTVTGLVGGGFFVAWSDTRASLAESDVYGTYVGADGIVATPNGIPIARTTAHETGPVVSASADPDHVVVLWSEYPDVAPRAPIQVKGAAVSKSQARARTAFVVDATPGAHATLGAVSAAAEGVVAYVSDLAGPAGGSRALARTIAVGKASGAACVADADCVTEQCTAGKCSEPAAPPGSVCGDPCAVLDPNSNACVAASRGTTPANAACAGYVCDGSSLVCPTTCQSSADCTPTAECDANACVVVRSCTGESTLSDRGAVVSCGMFRCDPVLAECFDRCTSKDQCATGLVCTDDGACEPPPAAADGGCNTTPSGNVPASLLALGLVVWALARRRRALPAAAALLGALVSLPQAAHAADARVGASQPVTTVPGTAFTPAVGPDMPAPSALALPGATVKGLLRVGDRAGAWRDGAFGASGLVGWSPAIGALGSRVNCNDGSVLAIERTNVAGRTSAWLLHYVDGAVPTHRIPVPETVAAAGTCTTDGAWIQLGEATDAYERYVWATGARAQRVEAGETGTTPFFRDAVLGWVVLRNVPAQTLFVVNADRSVLTSTPVQPGTVIIGLGTRVAVGFNFFNGESVLPFSGLASATDAAVTWNQAADVAVIPGVTGFSAVPRNDGRSVTYRSGGTLVHLDFPEGDVAPARLLLAPPPASPLAGNAMGYVRGANYELDFDDGTHREFLLADLTEVGAASALITAAPRALRLAAHAGGVTRLLGYQSSALTLFRLDAAPKTLTLGPGQEAQTPSDLQGLPDGRATLTTRDAATFSGHVLSATDALAPFTLIDAATSTVNLGDGVAAIHFIDNGATTTFTYRHISATVGETTRSVDVPRPVLEWGLRSTTAIAAVGNVAWTVFARGIGGGEQHLDWARIEQGMVTPNLPLTRAFYMQSNPKIACDPRGIYGCLAAWEDYRKNEYDPDVYAARILPDGTTPDGNGILIAGGTRLQTEPSVLWTDDDDHFFIAWRDSVAAQDRQPGIDPSLLRGAFVRHDGTVEDPTGIDLTDESQDEMAPILFDAARGTFHIGYQVFVDAADISSNQLAIRTIVAGKLRGDGCTTDLECAGRACIDGICCEATCNNGCGTCNQPGNLGTCVPRADGAESYQDRCGSYVCDGTLTSCPSTCRDDSDCATNSTCDPVTRTCSGGDGSVCQDETTEGASDAGAATSCLPFRCLRGRCADRCTSIDECAPGNVCTSAGRCEPTPLPADGGCSAGPGRSASESALFVSIGLLGLAVLARSRRKDSQKNAQKPR